ncbi:protein LOL3-like [Curcuma longa]|uniref:protein LOL3-like n=1 Tax=Curcuma longa TaxID=136217 RepID=UPI003D9DC9D7
MQRQLVCNGCRSVLLYPRGATNVCCAICNNITAVPPPGMEMAHLVCGGCRILLMYNRGAKNVRCSCCNTINFARPVNRVAHLSCAHCHTMLVYPYGAPSVKCAICHYVMNIGMNNTTTPIPAARRPNEITPVPPSTSSHASRTQNTTVVVENPMSVDKSGKLVTNLVVGVTTGKK